MTPEVRTRLHALVRRFQQSTLESQCLCKDFAWMCVYKSRKLEIDPVFVWIAGDSVGECFKPQPSRKTS